MKTMISYADENKPIFYSIAAMGGKEGEEWINFRNFCLNERNGLLSDIIGIIENYPKAVEIGNREYINLKQRNIENLEVGGHYGCGCVWAVARWADNVITSYLPDMESHPNFAILDHSHGFDVNYALMNPYITQGQFCLHRQCDPPPVPITPTIFPRIPLEEQQKYMVNGENPPWFRYGFEGLEIY